MEGLVEIKRYIVDYNSFFTVGLLVMFLGLALLIAAIVLKNQKGFDRILALMISLLIMAAGGLPVSNYLVNRKKYRYTVIEVKKISETVFVDESKYEVIDSGEDGSVLKLKIK